MADEKTITNVSTAAAAQQAQQQQSQSATGSAELGQQEFLTLLVNQLKNQDPLNPLESEEFAVQLAQFSQLEQLMGINEKLDTNSTAQLTPMTLMASFLGHEVVVRDQALEVANGEGPNVLVDVPGGSQSLRIDLIDANGQVAGSINVDNPEPGQQAIAITGASVPNGAYGVRVVAVNEGGEFVNLDGKVTATVEGFILEPEPALIVNGEQVAMEDIVEVYTSGTRG